MFMVDMAIRWVVLIPADQPDPLAEPLARDRKLPFFQNDFAGRIANRVMQTAPALRESTMMSIRACGTSARTA